MNCKPGDLAVIVNAEHLPELIGRYVIVGERAPEDQLFRQGCGEVVWWISAANGGQLPATFSGGLHRCMLKERPMRDDFLRPITPPAGTITETEVTALYTPTEIKRAKESVE